MENLFKKVFFQASQEEFASQSTRNAIRKKQLKAIRCLIILLPDANRKILKDLFEYLFDVAKNSELNLMNADCLGTIFFPLLLCSREVRVLFFFLLFLLLFEKLGREFSTLLKLLIKTFSIWKRKKSIKKFTRASRWIFIVIRRSSVQGSEVQSSACMQIAS